jgi:hypothetical protein
VNDNVNDHDADDKFVRWERIQLPTGNWILAPVEEESELEVNGKDEKMKNVVSYR